MPDLVQQYIEANDNASDYADSLIEGLERIALEDIDDLYNNDEARDPDLWTEFEVSPDLVVGDYEDEAEDRDLNWTLGLAGLVAASQTQFFLGHREETIIKPSAYRAQVLAGFALTRAQLIQAGKRGAEIVGRAQFEALQASYLQEFVYIHELSNVELYNALLDYRAIRPIEQTITRASGYVARMTNYRAGSPQFKEAVSNLISTSSKRGLKSANRQAVTRLHTLREAGADLKKNLVWIGEGGKNTCSYCLSNFGEVHTLEVWEEIGMPGAEVCAGGDL